jgi:hypothetical protein
LTEISSDASGAAADAEALGAFRVLWRAPEASLLGAAKNIVLRCYGRVEKGNSPSQSAIFFGYGLARLDLATVHSRGGGHGLSQLRDDFLSEVVVIGLDGETGGVGMASPAERFGDSGDVDAVFGA